MHPLDYVEFIETKTDPVNSDEDFTAEVEAMREEVRENIERLRAEDL